MAQPQDQKIAANATPIPFAANAEYATFLVYGAKFEVEKKYRLVKPIGHGAYGVVCSAINLANGQKIAIKKISKAFHNTNQTKRTLREIRILRHFNHPNILRLYDLSKPRSWEEFDDIYMVTELLDTDLHQIINSGQQLTDDHMQYFMYQILKGVKYIHSAHVIHRDLKPSNVLVNANCELKICDFGLARVARPEENNPGFLTEYVATRWYRAPEIMLSWKEYTQAVDMWAVGCIFAELLGRKPLFPGRDYMHQLHLVIETLGTPSAEDTEYIANEKAKNYVRSLPFQPRISFQKLFPAANPLALDLLEKMLAFAPEKRITVQQALEHPYLAALHDPAEETTAPELFNFDFELQAQSKEAIKALIWNDIAAIHPELPRLAIPSAPPPQQLPLSPVAPADMDMN